MSEEQRSLSGYKTKINEGTEFSNPNEDKPLLNDSDEYVFSLTTFPRVKTFQQVKQNNDGSSKTVSVDKAICEFREESTGNIVTSFFRVDSINFSEDETYESGVVRFFRKIKTPLIDGIEPDWEKYFLPGMRFRGRVVIGRGADKKPNHNYYLDIPTCRPILPSDKHNAEPDAPRIDANASLVANALLIAHGCHNGPDALVRLTDSNVKAEVIQAFIVADKAGKITYPVR